MQIKEVMIREVISVSPEMPIIEVAQILIKHNIHAVPVVDAENKVLGLISETDFFLKNSVALHLPTYVDLIAKEIKKEDAAWKQLPEIQALLGATAKDIMTPNCITLPEVADVRDLLTLVRQHHYKTFPITDPRGTLIGIVSLIDVVACIDQLYEKK